MGSCSTDVGSVTNNLVIGHSLDSIARDNMASGIVNTLKTKIKENAEALEKYEVLAEENKKKLTSEKKVREEAESEVSAMQRKIKLLEDNLERNQNRLEVITINLQNATETLESSDDGRQAIESKYESTAEKIESLEKQVAEAKKIAEDSDQKCEEIVRKLVLAEHHKDRAEERATRYDNKIVGLQTELPCLTTSVASSLQFVWWCRKLFCNRGGFREQSERPQG